MATGTAATSAREYHFQTTHYLRKRISGADGNALYTLGTIPAGANIVSIFTAVRVVFAGGTPTISFGPSGTPAGYFALTGAPATTVGRNAVALIATATLLVDVDTVITATVAGTPTSGTLDVEVFYTVDNDQ